MLRLTAVLLALALAGPVRAGEVNPCDFTGFDKPCEVPDGTYRALKPAGGTGPFPAVVFLHGSGGRSDRIAESEYFRETVTARGYVLIAPAALDAVRYVGGRDTGWSLRARPDHPRDDVAFLRSVLDHAEKTFRIDRRRVILAGQSDGGFLIWEIACHGPGLAAAYAVHAGSYGGAWPERCTRPVRFLHGHGRKDRIVPFEAERHSWGRLTAADPREGLALLARANGCREAGRMRRFNGFERTGWEGCARGAALDYFVHDGGHGFPWQWMPAVLDWFEEFDLAPAAVGQVRILRAGERSGRFKAVPE